MDHFKKVVILSVSSDIGFAYAKRRLQKGDYVCGTYRNKSKSVSFLEKQGAHVIRADFEDEQSISSACDRVSEIVNHWDELLVCTGILDPIGRFEKIDFNDWAKSFRINFVSQLRAVHSLLKVRNKEARVIFFAGSGTNGPADRFSCYTASKIALIKMTELLDSEFQDVIFTIIGPGWINTKIHNQTIMANNSAGRAYVATKERIKKGDFGPMEELLDCIDWVVSQPKEIIGGRNISSQNDNWGKGLEDILISDSSAGKLRRYRNRLLSNKIRPTTSRQALKPIDIEP
jgi:NAD(P)-dependent dehydrogenase (short-subunit alcohol dehydrogenase family)